MTPEEHREHAELIHKWGCSDITTAQLERLTELDSLVRSGGGGGVLVGDDKGESNKGPRSTTVKAQATPTRVAANTQPIEPHE